MKLKKIDKAIYRQRLNRVIAATIVGLASLSLGVSTLLIEVIGGPSGSNLMLNIIGVAVGAAVVGVVLRHYRNHPYMEEVVYVWRLKQELNRIYRCSAKLNPAVESNDINALIIMNFNLKASKQLYELDDNDLTMDELNGKIKNLDDKLVKLGLSISTDDYKKALLDQLG